MSENTIRSTFAKTFLKVDLPVKITVVFFFTLLILRLTEYLYFLNDGVPFIFQDLSFGILNDLLFASFVGLFFIILFAAFPKRYQKFLSIFNIIVITILTLLSLGLNEYYYETMIPLDQSLLIYSWSDIVYITSSSIELNAFMIARGFLVIAVLVTCIVFVYKINALSVRNLMYPLFIIFTAAIFNSFIIPDIKAFSENRSYYQRVNKILYLGSSIWENYHSTLELSKSDIIKTSKQFQKQNRDFRYLTPQYPFLRQQTQKDVLGQYFEFNNENPNIVFIIVESLSRKFSGPGAEYGSFTPFLDSLAGKSLYWENFLSTSERTFGVLPSTLASLPYGEKGFMALAEEGPYPEFISFPEITHRADYQNNFFYGGWINFDKMNIFLDSLKFQNILTDKKFGDNYEKIQESVRGFSWGYPDHAVYLRAMEILDSIGQQPRLDVYMTLSMHFPMFPPDEGRWIKKFHNHLETMEIKESDMEFYLKREMIFATILYADNAINQLIFNYSKRPGFNNTIFVIMGDHHMAISDFSPIEKYHVPMMIYSPMVKKHQVFPGVSSAADITPTIIGLLKNNFKIETPRWVPWIGRQLDTSSVFQSKNFIPLMRVNRNIDELLYNDLFYSEGRLYQIGNDLNLTPIDNSVEIQLMEERIQIFKALNQYVCTFDVIYDNAINN
jgi:uncharacterized sulfatase